MRFEFMLTLDKLDELKFPMGIWVTHLCKRQQNMCHAHVDTAMALIKIAYSEALASLKRVSL